MEEHSLAYEMLAEIKKSNKRWFIIAVIELVIMVMMIVSFFVYESQYEYSDETYQYVEDAEMDNSMIDQKIGE